jgi:hypothetical protein
MSPRIRRFVLAALVGCGLLPTAAHAQDPNGPRLMATRNVLAHGRVDSGRPQGIAGAGVVNGRPVPGLPAVFKAIAAFPNPSVVTLQLDKDGRALNPKNTLIAAGPAIPSGMTLIVAELPPGSLGAFVAWEPVVRFGNGNFYATVSIPEKKITAGMELYTDQHFKDYKANSILWEAPDFGNIVVNHALQGGTTAITARVAIKPGTISRSFGWANPLDLELIEEAQVPDFNGGMDLRLLAKLPNTMEPALTIRYAVETSKETVIRDVAVIAAPAKAGLFREARFRVPIKPNTDGQIKISAVASPGPFAKPLPKPPQAVGLETFHSFGPTLEDTMTTRMRKLNELVHKGRLAKTDPFDRVRKQHHAKVYPTELKQGQVYIIDLESYDGNRDKNRPDFFDTYLRIEDAGGKEVASDDDGGEGLNARILFTPQASGTYRIIATSFSGGATGPYVLRIRW